MTQNNFHKLLFEVSKWYRKKSDVTKTSLKALLTFVSVYGGAIIENQVQIISNQSLWPSNWGHASVVFLAVVAAYLLIYTLGTFAGNAEKREKEQEETLQYATSLSNQYFTKIAQDTISRLEVARDAATLSDALITHPTRLQTVVDDAYQLFESRYGKSGALHERIDFEVTFMTKSYIDHGITIPFYANRYQRAPVSMKQREGDPNFYQTTVAADLYRIENSTPTLRIVEDTGVDSTYRESYPGQKQRIKSSLIYPVLTPKNDLVGVLVVHCNMAGFFQKVDEKYWTEVLERFSARLALDKVLLDALVHKQAAIEENFHFKPKIPF